MSNSTQIIDQPAQPVERISGFHKELQLTLVAEQSSRRQQLFFIAGIASFVAWFAALLLLG